MTNKAPTYASCEDGEICQSCTIGGEMLKLGLTPRFKVDEEKGHCAFYNDAPHDNSGEYDHQY